MKIVVFWHNYLVNDWKELITDQFKKLYQSGLYDAADKIYCGVTGLQYCLDEYSKFIKETVTSYTATNKIEIRSSTENAFEYLTINWLKEYCDINDAYVLYFHTKGISIPMHSEDRILAEDWKNCMMYFNIEKWKNCVTKLDEGHDATGICYRKRKHFLGNFWWANSIYIKKLMPVLDHKAVVCRRRIKRFWYEKWLFNYDPNKWVEFNPKVHCFYSPDEHYRGERRLLPEEYIGK